MDDNKLRSANPAYPIQLIKDCLIFLKSIRFTDSQALF